MASQVPLVDYLTLGDAPHLVAHECSACGARYFDRRNECANCGGTTFGNADVATDGEVRSFTIVTFAAPGVTVPFVSAIVDCYPNRVFAARRAPNECLAPTRGLTKHSSSRVG